MATILYHHIFAPGRRGSRLVGQRYAIAAATAIFLCASHAVAQPHPQHEYPGPACRLPEFEVLPEAEDAKTPDKTKANLYDFEVRQYNREVEAYSVCIRRYIAKANSDAQQIQAQAADEAKRITDNANASIAVIRSQIRKATANAKKISNTPASALVGK
jgi:hypothetical protein